MRFPLLLFVLCCWFSAVGREPEDPPNSSPLDAYVRVAEITISGNEKTLDRIILRELSITKDQLVRSDSIEALIEQNKLRLATASLFTDYNISVDTLNRGEIAVHLVVKERWYIWPEVDLQLADRNFNVWWKEQNRDLNRAILGVRLNHRNFRGRNERLIVNTKVGYRQELSFGYNKPYVDKDQKHGFGVLVGVAKANEIFYTTDSNKLAFVKKPGDFIVTQYQASVNYSYRPRYSTTHVLRLTYKHNQVSDTILELNHDYNFEQSSTLNFLELSYRFDINKVDNWNYPLKGTKMVTTIFALGGLKGMDFQAYSTIEAGHFYNPFGKWYTSAIFRGKVSFPDWQPYTLREALGTKYNYIRGYEYYVIDGSQFGLVRYNVKRELVNTTIRNIPFKYLPAIPIRIYPKVFGDVGYVYNRFPGNSFLNNKLLYSAGVGLDFFTAYDLKVRFEYAWNHLGQKGLFLHFISE